MKQKYTYWKDEDMWLGYFDEFQITGLKVKQKKN